MPEIKASPFKRTRLLQQQITEFLDKLSEAVMVFEQGVLHYIDHGADETVESKYEQLSRLEARGDELRRNIEITLYTEMLIPDARSDVLALLNDADALFNALKKRYLVLVIERPEIPEAVIPDLRELVSVVAKCLEMGVVTGRTYFRDPGGVRDHIHKIGFHESEADKLGIAIRRAVSGAELSVGRKLLVREFVISVDGLADMSETIGDRLAIYAVKRAL